MGGVELKEITEAEIRKAVTADLQTSNFKVIDFIVRPASDNPLGFLGDHVRININVQFEGEVKKLQYFAKKIPSKLVTHYDYAQKTGAFYKEIELYKTVFCDFRNAISPGREDALNWLPNFYYSRDSELLIVEDLSVKNYYMLPERTVMDLEHLTVCFDAVAAMHAASIIFEEKLNKGQIKTRSSKFTPGKRATLGELYPNLIFETEASDIKGHPGNTFWEAGFRSQLPLVEQMPGLTEDQRAIIKANLTDKLRLALQFVKPSKEFRNVILHGDLWANNILFRKDESGKVTDGVIVDYQLARYGPPAHDLLMCLHLVQTRDFRNLHEESLLNRFYLKLEEHLKAEGLEAEELLPRKEFDESVKYYKEYAILNSIMYFQLILTPSHLADRFFASDDMYQHNMAVDRSELIITCCQQDDICRSRMFEAMKELAEFYNWI